MMAGMRGDLECMVAIKEIKEILALCQKKKKNQQYSFSTLTSLLRQTSYSWLTINAHQRKA